MIKQKRYQKYQAGSALVESTLVLGVLLPVGLGIAMLGKLTDLQQTTEQAGRYSAWEATVYSRQALRNVPFPAVEERFFSSQDSVISSEAASAEPPLGENTLWGAQSAQGVSMREMSSVSLASNTAVSSEYTFDTGKASVSSAAGEVVAAAGKPLSGFKGNSWGLVADGLLRSSVDVAVKSTDLLHALHGPCGNTTSSVTASANSSTQQGDDKHVCMRAAGVILADGWSASHDGQATSRVRSLVPGSTLSRVGEGVGSLLGSAVFPELDSLSDAFGHVDMSVLPAYAKP